MPLAAVAVLKRGAVEEAVVVADDVAVVRLFPLGEAAIGMENLGDGGHLLVQGSTTQHGCVLGDQAFGDAAEDKAGLLVRSQTLDLTALQIGHLLEHRLGQPIVTFWKRIVAPLGETIHVVRPARGAADSFGAEQVIALESHQMLTNCHGCQIKGLSQFVNSAAAVALDEGEDESLGTVHFRLRRVWA